MAPSATETISAPLAALSVHAEGKKEQANDVEIKKPDSFAGIATGGIPFPSMPKFDDPYKKRQWQLEHMAGAFRVFARKGFTEGTAGHISVRDPVDPSTFWINPSVLMARLLHRQLTLK